MHCANTQNKVNFQKPLNSMICNHTFNHAVRQSGFDNIIEHEISKFNNSE